MREGGSVRWDVTTQVIGYQIIGEDKAVITDYRLPITDYRLLDA